MTLTAENAMFGHTDEETAFVVDDYPYGFRLRTQIRFWIESVKGKGDRFCSQTMNPKTGRWNKAKKSTYSPVMAMYMNEEGHVTHASVSQWAEDAWIAEFRAVAGDHLSEVQKRNLAVVLGMKKAFEGVTTVIRNTSTLSEEERAKMDAEHAAAMNVIRQRAGVATAEALRDLR
jgi:hypothetical protein